MEDKYYIPDISEFRVGFEYELYDGQEWIKDEITLWTDLKSLFDCRDKCGLEVRVKILDQQDIEELRFKHVGGKLIKDVRQEFSMFNGRFWVHLNYTKFSNRCVLKIETSVEENSVRTLVVHSIRCNNKSELKVLLKKLGIDGK